MMIEKELLAKAEKLKEEIIIYKERLESSSQKVSIANYVDYHMSDVLHNLRALVRVS